MKIGIDIDNTLTEVQNELNIAAYNYDRLIVNARKKAPICKEENIDIFIDDQLNKGI